MVGVEAGGAGAGGEEGARGLEEVVEFMNGVVGNANASADGRLPRAPRPQLAAAAAQHPQLQNQPLGQPQQRQQQQQQQHPTIPPGSNAGVNSVNPNGNGNANANATGNRGSMNTLFEMFAGFPGAMRQAQQVLRARGEGWERERQWLSEQLQAQNPTQAPAPPGDLDTEFDNPGWEPAIEATIDSAGNITDAVELATDPIFDMLLDQLVRPAGAGPNPRAGAGANAAPAPERPRKEWTLPPAPGPTLRERVERREREAGLRCFDVSCGVGPSDDDPSGSGSRSDNNNDRVDATGTGGVVAAMKQLAIMTKGEGGGAMCAHTFHSGCLISAERVALSARGADVGVVLEEDGRVVVSCPVCRNVGCVSKAEWDEGVLALA
ncbi:hypothetical protein B0H34DRAFT_706691 [Crassisporium funariophilum]|nr:hypothetical protein B0H34DRAFT_706691 [Crassisporium funariophilum]